MTNLFHILKKFKMASILNILGLSIAFASFILIMNQVFYERSANTNHENYSKIARLESSEGEGVWAGITARPFSFIFKGVPNVKETAFVNQASRTQTITVDDGGQERSVIDITMESSASLPRVFTFDFIESEPDPLEIPNGVIIPESLANALFHNVPAFGQNIRFNDQTWTITGVFRDFAKNDILTNRLHYSLREKENWNWWQVNDTVYFLFEDENALDATTLLNAVKTNINLDAVWGRSGQDGKQLTDIFRFTPLKDIYYTNDVQYVFCETGNRQTTFVLICVAILILIIAGINYTNFNTALTPMRIKSINTRKVLGSSVTALRLSLVAEGVVVSLLSYLVAVGIVLLCKGSFVENLFSGGIQIAALVPIFALAAAISIVVGALAGLYPSFYMTSFSPALVLKGSFGLSPKGKRVRSLLMSVQYISSVALLVVAAFMILQNRYMIKGDMGYDNDQILTVAISDDVRNRKETFAEELKKLDGVEQVAYTFQYLSADDNMPHYGRQFDDKYIDFFAIPATIDILQTLGIELSDGRNFLKGDYSTEGGAFIFNEKAAAQFDLKPGDIIFGEVVGIVPNISFRTMRNGIEPMAFELVEKENWMPLNVCNIRISKDASVGSLSKKILNVLAEFDPSTSFDVVRLNSHIEGAYSSERNTASIISLFCIISFLISLVGLYGLVVFETEYKKREIGIRKVFGSTIAQIMKMFTFSSLKLIVICSIIAAPISYFFVKSWLTNFAVRVPIYWWVFVLAFVVVSFVTIATCSLQNYKAANENPVKSLKAE